MDPIPGSAKGRLVRHDDNHVPERRSPVDLGDGVPGSSHQHSNLAPTCCAPKFNRYPWPAWPEPCCA